MLPTHTHVIFTLGMLLLASSVVLAKQAQPSFDPHLSQLKKTLLQDLTESSFSSRNFKKYIHELTKSAHPAGSARQKELSEWLESQLKAQKVFLGRLSWKQRVPQTKNPMGLVKSAGDVFYTHHQLRNVMGKVEGGRPCSLLVGSHYDSKDLYGRGVNVGANDSGSSSAALLLLAEFLSQRSRKELCDIYLVFFDGEESVLWDWYASDQYAEGSDHLYGSRHLASLLVPSAQGYKFPPSIDSTAKPLRAVMILDMIGSRHMKLTLDDHSSPFLKERLLKTTQLLGLAHRLSAKPLKIEDDHLPFLKRGIPALLLIDFNNLDLWHTPKDLPQYLDFSSVRDVLKMSAMLLYDFSSSWFLSTMSPSRTSGAKNKHSP